MVEHWIESKFRPLDNSKSQEKSDNMTPFAVFAIVLTLAYIIYYGFVVSRDLTRKAIQEETNEESIDVDVFKQTEKPEAVKSVGDGFQVGNRQAYQPEPLPDVISLDGDGNSKAEGIDAVLDCEHLLHKAGEAKEMCEDTEPEYEEKIPSDEYAQRMEKHQMFPEESSGDGTSPTVDRL